MALNEDNNSLVRSAEIRKAAMLKRAGRTANGFMEVVEDLFAMPSTMKQLAVVQFFSWFGLFAMWIYTTPVVAQYAFGSSDPASASYNEGGNWVGILFAVYNGVAALAALFLTQLQQFVLGLGAAGRADSRPGTGPHRREEVQGRRGCPEEDRPRPPQQCRGQQRRATLS